MNEKLVKPGRSLEELEKENAELKRLKRECETSLCRAEYQYNYEQLTKAKELLRELYSIVKVECSPFAREEHKNILTEILEFLEEE